MTGEQKWWEPISHFLGHGMNKAFFVEFSAAAKEAPRLYFAPLAGAVKAIRQELRLVTRAVDQESPSAVQPQPVHEEVHP